LLLTNEICSLADIIIILIKIKTPPVFAEGEVYMF
jgi:hypothetical protein